MNVVFAFWFIFGPWLGVPMLVDPGLEEGAFDWSAGLGNWGDYSTVARTHLAARTGRAGLRCIAGDPYYIGRAEISRRTESADTPAGRYVAVVWFRGRGTAQLRLRAVHDDWTAEDAREVRLTPWWRCAVLTVTLPEGGTPVYVSLRLTDIREGDWVDVDDWQIYRQPWGGVR